MNQKMNFAQAFHEVSAGSMGGAPFLIAYGATFIITGILSYVLPAETAALIAMFQGGAALPAALWLERKMGRGRMAAEVEGWEAANGLVSVPGDGSGPDEV